MNKLLKRKLQMLVKLDLIYIKKILIVLINKDYYNEHMALKISKLKNIKEKSMKKK
jgi:hypothetical protein